MSGHKVKPEDLVKFAKEVHWQCAARTFGSSHATLIGLLVDSWVRLDPNNHWVLEGAPRIAPLRTQSDGILAYGNHPVGVMEIEGNHPIEICDKVHKYLDTCRSLSFGLCVFYAVYPRKPDCTSGRSSPGDKELFHIIGARYNHEEQRQCILTKVRAIASQTERLLMIVFVEKVHQSRPNDLDPEIELRTEDMGRSGYSLGRVCRVQGYLFNSDKEPKRIPLWGDATLCTTPLCSHRGCQLPDGVQRES